MFLENLLICNVAVYLKQIANQSASGRQLFVDRSITRKIFYQLDRQNFFDAGVKNI